MKSYDLVLFNMSNYAEWEQGVSNRNYHVLEELLRYEHIGKILAVDYLPMTAKRSLRTLTGSIARYPTKGAVLRRSLTHALSKVSDRLYVYSDTTFFLRAARVIQSIRATARELGFRDFLIWSYFPFVMPYLDGFGHKMTIFDAVDNWAEHASYMHFKTRLQSCYAHIKHHAHIIFTVSEELQTLFDSQPNVYWVPNGVDVTRYATKRRLVNRDIADVPKPIIGYIGVVQERVDIDLIITLAKKNTTKSFVVIGPIWSSDDQRRLDEVSNIYVLGYKSYDEAASYVQQFDAGIIPHKKSSFIQSTNPMKMYEYLAAGIPVVATKGSGAEMFKEHVYIADSTADFNRKLFSALQEDSEARRSARKKAVEPHSWTNTVKHMLAIVDKKYSY